MTDKVKYTSLTPITSDSQLRRAVNDIIANLAPLTGQHRERGNQAVTWLDLINAGFQYDFDGNGDFILPPVVDPEEPDMSTPPALDGFTAVASFNFITLSWSQPKNKSHSHVEIWRATGFKTVGESSNIPTVLGDAVFRIMSPSIVVSDTVLPGDVWRYWARSVSKTGVFGPWTSVDGLLVEVPEDPAYILDMISGEIRQGDLYPALGDKIEASFEGYQENALLLSAQGVTLAQHTSTLSSHGVAIQQQSQINSEQGALINAAWTVRIDSGNAVSGFGLMVDGSTGRSDFIIRADRFAIAAPQAYDQNGKPIVNTSAFPFIVDVTNPAAPKTLIKNAYIDQAFIQTLVTGSLVADRITGQTLTGTHIRGGDMVIGANFNVDGAGSATMLNAFIKGTMQSNNYAAGSAGWQVRNDGYAEFRQAVIRGTVYADDGYFNGTVYAEKMVGGVYSYASKPTATNNGVSSIGAWVTAFTAYVNRGMPVARKLGFKGTVCRADLFAGGVGSGGAEIRASAQFIVRVLRDGFEVASQSYTISGSDTFPYPSGGASISKGYDLDIDFVVDVPSDSAAHTYTVQYVVSAANNDSNAQTVTGTVSTIGAAFSSLYRTSVSLFITTGDLT